MNNLLVHLVETSTAYVLSRVERETSPKQKLAAFIDASLAYQGTHHAHNTALIEIIFNARTPENTPYYKLGDDDDQIRQELRQILTSGQEQGMFGTFNVDVVATVIQGAIAEYMLASPTVVKTVDLETYSKELIGLIEKLVVSN
jgi:hypothetical protein